MKKATKDSEKRDRARNNNENMKRMLSTSSGTGSNSATVVFGKSDTKRWMADTILPNFVQSGNQARNKRNSETVKSKSAIKYDQLNADDYDSIVPNVPRPADIDFKFNPDNSCPLPIHISSNLTPSEEMCDPSHIELKCPAEPSNKPWSNNGILLQIPKNIRWQAETKSVNLDRGDKSSFGFKFKLIYERVCIFERLLVDIALVVQAFSNTITSLVIKNVKLDIYNRRSQPNQNIYRSDSLNVFILMNKNLYMPSFSIM